MEPAGEEGVQMKLGSRCASRSECPPVSSATGAAWRGDRILRLRPMFALREGTRAEDECQGGYAGFRQLLSLKLLRDPCGFLARAVNSTPETATIQYHVGSPLLNN